MDFTLLVNVIQTLGMPIAALVGIAWFVAFRIWPYLTTFLDSRQKASDEHQTSIAKALQNSSELTVSLVQVTVSMKATLEEMSRTLRDLHDGLNDVREDLSAIYERSGEERPSRQARKQREVSHGEVR